MSNVAPEINTPRRRTRTHGHICYRHRLALLVCIPRRVHVSSFERHFHSIEIPFPHRPGPARPGSRPVVYRSCPAYISEISKQISVRDDEPDETIAAWREGCQIVFGSDANNGIVHPRCTTPCRAGMSDEVTIARQVTRAVSSFKSVRDASRSATVNYRFRCAAG